MAVEVLNADVPTTYLRNRTTYCVILVQWASKTSSNQGANASFMKTCYIFSHKHIYLTAAGSFSDFDFFFKIHNTYSKCWRAAQNALRGRMWPAGRSLPTPGIVHVEVLHYP